MEQNETKVKMLIEMPWLRDVLEKYCPSIRGMRVRDIPENLTMEQLYKENGLNAGDIQKMGSEVMASLENFRKKTATEAYEFDPDVDLNDDHYLWESEENKEKCVVSIERRYAGRTGEIIFYGPSNITLWYSLEKDMLPWKAQNHGMGGCTDEDLMRYADRLLYPFQPRAVFFQSGSNDLTYGFTPEQIVENKKKMYSEFLNKLPESELIIMSGLPLPGRTAYWEDTRKINQFLSEYTQTHPRLHYMDATDVMMSDEGDPDMLADSGRYFIPGYFRLDQIHLNKKGHDVWTGKIKSMLEELGI